MDTPESLIAAPLAISLFFGAQVFFNGPAPFQKITAHIPELAASVPVSPVFLLVTLGALLVSGGLLVALEMKADKANTK